MSPPSTADSRSVSELLTPSVVVGGVPLHTPDTIELESVLHRTFDGGRLRRVSTVRLRDLWRARKDPHFRSILSRLDLGIAAGQSMASWTRLTGQSLPKERWIGDLADLVLRVAREVDRSVFFLGGEGCAPYDWARRAHYRFPGVRLAGAFAPGPDFRDAEGGRRLLDRINDSGADVIVALPTTARGEEFPSRYASRLDAELYVNLWSGLSGHWQTPSAWKPRAARESLQIVPASRVVLMRN
ncbi:MAG: hypothetical protein CMJ83_18190 [Planctomycetes bacterium]|nr:hypothetical protein [Planctomycetota bacterium]